MAVSSGSQSVTPVTWRSWPSPFMGASIWKVHGFLGVFAVPFPTLWSSVLLRFPFRDVTSGFLCMWDTGGCCGGVRLWLCIAPCIRSNGNTLEPSQNPILSVSKFHHPHEKDKRFSNILIYNLAIKSLFSLDFYEIKLERLQKPDISLHRRSSRTRFVDNCVV